MCSNPDQIDEWREYCPVTNIIVKCMILFVIINFDVWIEWIKIIIELVG